LKLQSSVFSIPTALTNPIDSSDFVSLLSNTSRLSNACASLPAALRDSEQHCAHHRRRDDKFPAYSVGHWVSVVYFSVRLGPFESTHPLGEQREEVIMIALRNLVATWVRSATAVLGTVVFAPFLVFADSIPVTPEQISVTPQPTLPTFQEVGKAGAMPFVLTVKNISKTQTIGVKASNPISAVIVSNVEIGHVDRSDTLVPPSAFSSTTCIKPNGLPVLLAPGRTCTFTYLLTPVAGPPCPDKNEEPCDSGATTIKFTVNPSLGPSVSTEPTFIVEDVPKTAEPASLILFAFGALGLAGCKWLRTIKPVHMQGF
jgi:hypothetical protein